MSNRVSDSQVVGSPVMGTDAGGGGEIPTTVCVFHPIKGKMRSSSEQVEEVTPQHKEIVRFVNEGNL